MNRQKHFVTIFPKLRKVNLYKDVGQIPFYFARRLGWKASLVFCQPNEAPIHDVEYESEVELIHLATTDERWEKFKRITAFLVQKARHIDVLNLYQLGVESMWYASIYRLLNPKGCVFLKLDMDAPTAAMLLADERSVNKIVNDELLRLAPIDFFTVETRRMHERVRDFFEKRGKSVYLVPNGFSCDRLIEADTVLDEKENVLLTVGRLGMPQKNTELLLDALEQLPAQRFKDWKVYLVGSMYNDFADRIAQLKVSHPHLDEALVVTGHIDDRDRLYDLYRRARVFCLTSRWESFGLVLLEAMYFGCYLVSTDVGAAADATCSGELGTLIESEDSEGLATALRQILSGEHVVDEPARRGHQRIVEEFSWAAICEKLEPLIEAHCG